MGELSFALPSQAEIDGISDEQKTLWFNLSPKKEEGGFRIGLRDFYVKIDKGAFCDTRVKAVLYIPRLMDVGQEIGINLSFDQDGDFDVTATFPSQWPANISKCKPAVGLIGLPSIFMFKMDKLSVGKDDDAVYLETSGSLRFTHKLITKIIKDDLEIKKLYIDTKGNIEVEGGTLPLPKNKQINLGPAKVSITAVHTGKMDRGGFSYNYIGFSGGVSINPGGVDVSGDSFKVCYRKNGTKWDVFLHIEGLGIDIVIPGNATKQSAALIIEGYLSMKRDYYEGSISLKMPKMNIAGGATMKLDTKTPSFYIEAWLELPMPIPLGATNLGIYGFRGAFGKNYIAVKDEDERWFDWYRAELRLQKYWAQGMRAFRKMFPTHLQSAQE